MPPSSGSRPDTRLVEDLRLAHERLLFDAAAVQAAVESWPASAPDRDRIFRWARSVSDFRHDLLCHFALEEHCGFLDAAAQASPAAADEAASLREEHASFATALTALHARAIQAAVRPGPDLADLRARVRALLQAIRAHEQREATLIQRVFYPTSRASGESPIGPAVAAKPPAGSEARSADSAGAE